MRKILLITGLAVLLAVGSLSAEVPEGCVLCYGDSMTVSTRSYVSILDGRWTKTTFINGGRGGRKTSDRSDLVDLLDRMKKAGEKNAARGKKPLRIDWVFILLGSNDLKARATDATVGKCEENIGWMIDYLRKEIPGIKVVLLAPPNLDPGKMKEHGYEVQDDAVRRMAELESVYHGLAAEKQVRFVSLLNVVPAKHLTDGLHPDPEGQALIADAIVKAFSEPEPAPPPAAASGTLRGQS